jgi:protein-disulfide isomerase
MKRSLKELSLILAIVLAATVILFFRQVNKARKIVIDPSRDPIISQGAFAIPITPNDFMLGNPGSPLTFVLFADLSDKKSREIYNIARTIVQANPLQARLVWKDLPTSGILRDRSAPHLAAHCAGQQDKFWPYVDLLVQDRLGLKKENLETAAATAGLNLQSWQGCLLAGSGSNKLEETKTLAQQLIVRIAPALYVNNKRINVNVGVDLNHMLNSFLDE